MKTADGRARRLRIGLMVLAPLAAAAVVGWLESGTWVVVENAGDDAVHDVRLQVRDVTWEIGSLEPGESRRRSFSAPTRGVCAIELMSSTHGVRRHEVYLDDGSTCVVRVTGGELATSAQPGAWRRWLRG